MNYEDRKPKQLSIKRRAHYDRVYSRQKQLMKRLNSLLNKSDIIEANTEFLRNPKVNPTSKTFLKKSKDEGSKKSKNKFYPRTDLRKEVNKFSNRKKKTKIKSHKKISEVRPDVLWGLS